MKSSVIVVLLLSLLPLADRGAAQPASRMQQDVDRLVRAAGRLTDRWPRQAPPPIREVAAVVGHGRAVVPLLMNVLSEDPSWEPDGGRWKVQQQVTLALSRIYAQGDHCGRIYCDEDPPERMANVKTGWRNVIAADEAKLRLPTSDLVERFLQQTEYWRQIEWGQALAENNDRQAVAALAPLLADEDRRLRGNAAFVLARLGDPRGFETLAAILSDYAPRPIREGVSGRNGPRGGTVKQQISEDRYYAANLLGRLKDQRGVAVLLPLLNDPDVDSIVPWSLGLIGDRRAIEPLIAQLRLDDPTKRVSAIWALEQLEAREALPLLVELLEDLRTTSAGDPVTVSESARRAIAVISSPR